MPSMAVAAAGAGPQFPLRPVRIIVPTAPGGSVDLIARVVAQRLGERWSLAGRTVSR